MPVVLLFSFGHQSDIICCRLRTAQARVA